MRIKGVSYDVGREMGFNWRPNFDRNIVRRELEIIRDDLHCNAVRICGLDLDRLDVAAKEALDLGLVVWLSPEMWDKTPDQTLTYLARAAKRAEELREQWQDKIVLSVGSELTLFMRGIIAGRNFAKRLKNPNLIDSVKAGEHNKPLNDFLTKANSIVRPMYRGDLTYASLVWEGVDWSLFDYVGVDHYRSVQIEDKYLEFLRPAFTHGKPVVITEFGYATCHEGLGSGGFLDSSGLGANLIDVKSQFLHYKIPFFGRFVRPHLNGNHVRDESWQARKLIEQLTILDGAGVDGGFIFQFISQITPYSDDQRYDLDMASSSLVKYYEGGRHGVTFQDMNWEPKEAFRAVAEYYSKR